MLSKESVTWDSSWLSSLWDPGRENAVMKKVQDVLTSIYIQYWGCKRGTLCDLSQRNRKEETENNTWLWAYGEGRRSAGNCGELGKEQVRHKCVNTKYCELPLRDVSRERRTVPG